MTGTLFVRKTPRRPKSAAHFKYPLRDIIARRVGCEHGEACVGSAHLDWFRGLYEATTDKSDRKDIKYIIDILEEGGTVDMWVEY